LDIFNDIVACVSIGLDSLYPGYPVFVELVPDELPVRCFLLGFAGEADIQHSIGSRYEVSGKLDIAYFSPKRADGANAENNTVFANLSLNLRHLSYMDVKLRIGSHHRRDVDGIMHDICDFSTFLYKINDAPLMREIRATPAIKE
jgi:hypothetical protein